MNDINDLPCVRCNIAANPIIRNGEDTTMKALITLFACVVALMLCNNRTSHAHHGGATAYAIPLTGIQIDGNLDDWPEGMIWYPILNIEPYFGPTDIDDADLTTSADLSPSFMAGFSLEENLIYIAVRVRDDSLMSTSDPWHNKSDVCAVYIDGTNSGNKIAPQREYDAATVPDLQYLMWSHEGPDGTPPPTLTGGDIAKTRTKSAFSREGDISIYEWAVEPFDRYPDFPTKLELGKIIGFDVSFRDADTKTDTDASVSWAPPDFNKMFNADRLGDLVLVESYKTIGSITGIVTQEKKPCPVLDINVYQGDKPAGSVKTNAEGRYKVILQPGEYTLKIQHGQGLKPFEKTGCIVSAGQELKADFAVSSIELSESLVQSITRYKSLKGYRDTTAIAMHMVRPGMDNQMTSKILFAFELPNHVRIESISDSPLGGVSLFSNGVKMVSYVGMLKQYTEEDAPQVLTSINLQKVQMPCFVAENIILSTLCHKYGDVLFKQQSYVAH